LVAGWTFSEPIWGRENHEICIIFQVPSSF
jgi:hypothetical protein